MRGESMVVGAQRTTWSNWGVGLVDMWAAIARVLASAADDPLRDILAITVAASIL